MMRFAAAFVLVTALGALGVTEAPAFAHGKGTWCAVVSAGPAEVEWDCQYYSIEECRPHVLSGNRGFCTQSPYVPDPPARKRPRNSRNGSIWQH